MSNILYDKRMLSSLKGRFYKVVMRPVILYGSECLAVDNTVEQMVSVALMIMQRRMCGLTWEEIIRNNSSG